MALIFGFGGSVLFIVFFMAAPAVVLPLADALAVTPTAKAFALSFGAAAIWAFLHGKRVKRKVAVAQDEHARALHAYQAKREAERMMKAQGGDRD